MIFLSQSSLNFYGFPLLGRVSSTDSMNVFYEFDAPKEAFVNLCDAFYLLWEFQPSDRISQNDKSLLKVLLLIQELYK